MAVVRGIVEEGPARIKELIDLGMSFSERANSSTVTSTRAVRESVSSNKFSRAIPLLPQGSNN